MKNQTAFNIEDYIIQPLVRERKETMPCVRQVQEGHCSFCSGSIFKDHYCFWHYQYEHYTSR